MKRKIIFSGCSFTWGQSLWAYEKEPKNIPCALEWTRLGYDISEELQETRTKYRFANLVSNSLGNYEPYVKRVNGGSDEESIRFVDVVMGKEDTDLHLFNETPYPNLVDGIVFQTTQAFRSCYPFRYKGKQYKLFSTPDMKNFTKVEVIKLNSDGNEEYFEIENGIDIFIEYLISKNIKVEEFAKAHIKKWIGEIENLLKNYHDLGKKVFLLSWTDEYLEEINKNNFLKSIFVPLYYDNKIFNCIDDLYNYNEEMRIDKHIKNRYMGFDEHPSSICHDVIANSILKKWNEKEI
mgnify:CR=1 FL=1|tara:strand:+ start:1358 stop:2236 length:879 start_codon:yes stop_codon:yes gene_type:complete